MEKKTAYVTKFGLTRGVFKAELQIEDGGTAFYKTGGVHQFLNKNQYAFSEDEAKEQVREMARRRLRALEMEKQKMLGIIANAAPPPSALADVVARGHVTNGTTRINLNSCSGTLTVNEPKKSRKAAKR